ncbi:MAG: HlyC/CorC family transporter [Anaerolineae bacterium]|nr:HlyC/CorC family transporter [Anaerolineae bacterium]
MNDLFIEILVIFLLSITNGIFAMSEMAIVSARKVRLQQLADTGNRQAQRTLKLADEPNKFLATIQIGITSIGVLSGAFGGATLAEEIALLLDSVPALKPYSEVVGVAVVVIGVTYLSLVIGELVPKRLALNAAERIAMVAADPMNFLSMLASPLVKLLSLSTDFVIWALGIQPSTEPLITQEEIEILIEQGAQSGVLEEVEQDILESVLRLDEQRVGAVMTARPQIVWLDLEDSLEILQQKIAHSPYSRFLVSKNGLDNILGVIYVRDILAQTFTDTPLELLTLLRPPLFVPENMPTLKLLELFKQKGLHVAVVVDEYSVIQGMVTDTDILESIVGDLPAIDEPEEPEAIQREDGSWLFDGMVPIDRVKKLLDIERLPDEELADYQTLGGFVIYRLESIPISGEWFECDHFRFEVVDMDGRRVDKVLVTPSRQNDLVEEKSGTAHIES